MISQVLIVLCTEKVHLRGPDPILGEVLLTPLESPYRFPSPPSFLCSSKLQTYQNPKSCESFCSLVSLFIKLWNWELKWGTFWSLFMPLTKNIRCCVAGNIEVFNTGDSPKLTEVHRAPLIKSEILNLKHTCSKGFCKGNVDPYLCLLKFNKHLSKFYSLNWPTD